MTKTGAHPVAGYVCAVVSAALSFVSIEMFYGMVFRGAMSTVYPVSERISQMMTLAIIMFFIMTFFTFFLAIIPVFIAHKVAERFSIKSLWYYVACGALTGLALSPVAVIITPRWYTDPPEVPPFLDQALAFARGAIGGLAYWLATGRFMPRLHAGLGQAGPQP
jgi:hypothetical protein